MNICLLGAGGFIGSHLAEWLLRQGDHHVVGFDLLDDKLKHVRGVANFEFFRGDIRKSAAEVQQMIREADVVVDLIAYVNPSLYVKMPLQVFQLNFTQNLKIAEWCVAEGRRLVQFSSCEVYGKTLAAIARNHLADPDDPQLALFDEDRTDFILGPLDKHRWIYASAKQLLERVLHAYGLENQLRYSIIRPFNFIGPRIDYLPSAEDENPRVFSHFMTALLTGAPMKLVNGGSSRRCYTYIDDGIECIGRVVLDHSGVCDRQVFNVGNPSNEVSIRDLAVRMRAIYDQYFRRSGDPLPDIVCVSAAEFYGHGYEDSDRRIPDIAKARTLLHWEPRFDIDETLYGSMRYYVEETRKASCTSESTPRQPSVELTDRRQLEVDQPTLDQLCP